MNTDPISDMLTRIRNAIIARHDHALVPASGIKLAIVKILREEGFIKDYEVLKGRPQRVIKIHLRYYDDKESAIQGLKRISKPGLRVYTQRRDIPRVMGGLGISIVSTSKGVMTGKQAWSQNLGGELLCFVW